VVTGITKTKRNTIRFTPPTPPRDGPEVSRLADSASRSQAPSDALHHDADDHP